MELEDEPWPLPEDQESYDFFRKLGEEGVAPPSQPPLHEEPWPMSFDMQESNKFFCALTPPSSPPLLTGKGLQEAEAEAALSLATAASRTPPGFDTADVWRLEAHNLLAQDEEASERIRCHYDLAAISFPAAEAGLVRDRVAYSLTVSLPGLPRGRTLECVGFLAGLDALKARLCPGKFPHVSQVVIGFALEPHFYKEGLPQRTTFKRAVAVGRECTVIPGSVQEDAADNSIVAEVKFTNAMRPSKAFAVGGNTKNTFMNLHVGCLYFDGDANTWIYATSAGAHLKFRSNSGAPSEHRNSIYATKRGAKRASSCSSSSSTSTSDGGDDDDDGTAAEGAKRGRAKPRKE
jgi:hypothetical protein